MCLAVPLKLTHIEGKTAIGELEGIQRKIRVDFLPDPKIGDYVIAHAGFAIERLNEEQALANLKAFQEVADAL
ncbi:MAG: HypC/HybG/HupF family hydrogenase formation chaperone [Oscillospiraceae bacterium]|nr:HypC/HybG/HupF family hydrogenase formation chaperone [Oscillospiraceae bacterium]